MNSVKGETRKKTAADIFIFHSIEDRKEPGALQGLLALLGFRCFLVYKDIRKGEKWREAIVRQLIGNHLSDGW